MSTHLCELGQMALGMEYAKMGVDEQAGRSRAQHRRRRGSQC